jgi:hypothetical protein
MATYCVLVRVDAGTGDEAWDRVKRALRGDDKATVAGAPRCDLAEFVDDYDGRTGDDRFNLVQRAEEV